MIVPLESLEVDFCWHSPNLACLWFLWCADHRAPGSVGASCGNFEKQITCQDQEGGCSSKSEPCLLRYVRHGLASVLQVPIEITMLITVSPAFNAHSGNSNPPIRQHSIDERHLEAEGENGGGCCEARRGTGCLRSGWRRFERGRGQLSDLRATLISSL